MPQITFPNQRMIHINRERVSSDFLGIKNENWQFAARDLGAHAFLLYTYCAANKDNFTLALSPTAVRQAIGMARSTYHDQFHKLVDKGYLIPSHGNTFEFYEKPRAATQTQNSMTENGQVFETCPSPEQAKPQDGLNVTPEDIEINNNEFPNKGTINTEVQKEKKEFIF